MTMQPGRWVRNESMNGVQYWPPGDYDPFSYPKEEEHPGINFLAYDEMMALLRYADEQGFIRPRMDDRSRDSDVKIINRMIDVVTIFAKGATSPAILSEKIGG